MFKSQEMRLSRSTLWICLCFGTGMVAPAGAYPAQASEHAQVIERPPAAASDRATKATEGESATQSAQSRGQHREVEVHVESTVNESIYLDVGREAGLRVGDRVWFELPGRARLAARVLAVSRKSARAEFEEEVDEVVEIGTRGTVMVPVERFAPAGDSGVQKSTRPGTGGGPQNPVVAAPWVGVDKARTEAPSLPEKPEWEYGQVEWEEDRPLLAPPSSRAAASKPVKIHGFTYVATEISKSDIGDDRHYRSRRAGLDMEVTNPFRRAGVFEVDLDYDERTYSATDSESETDTTLRVDQLSYRWGGVRQRPWRFEAGRFRHDELPELGRIDGVEVGHLFENGDRFSTSLGAVPERTDEVSTTSDAEFSTVYRAALGKEQRSSLALGAQQTWTEGETDRELLIASLDASLGRRTSLFGSAWVDHYGSDTEVKDEGFELTRLQLNALHRFEAGHNLSLFASHSRWPETERFKNLDADLLRNGSLTRFGASGRLKLTRDLRLRARADWWEDQDDDGGGRELGVDFLDLFGSNAALNLSVFQTEGSYFDRLGYRVGLNARAGFARFSLSYRSSQYEPVGSLGTDDEDTEQTDTFRASLDLDLGESYDLSLYAEEETEEEGDTRILGFELRRRF